MDERSLPQSIIAIGLIICVMISCFIPEITSAQEKNPLIKQLDSKATKALPGFGTTFVKGLWDVIDPMNKYELPNEKTEVLGEDGAKLVEKYRKGLRDNKFSTNLFEGIFDVSIWAAAAGATVAAPVAIVGAGVATFANRKATEALQANMTASTAKIFVSGLNDMNDEDKAVFSERLAQKDYLGAAQIFEARTHKLSAIALEVESITKEFGQGQAVQKLTEDLISKTLVEATEESLRAAAANYHEIQDVKKNVAQQVAFIKKFAKDTEGSIKGLAGDVKHLNEEIDQLKEGIESLGNTQSATAYQVEMIQEIMFGQQPASVKVQMLKSNMLPGLTKGQRDELTKLYTVEAKKAEIISDVTKIVSTARDVAKILGDLGIENKGIAYVVQYASVAQTALTFAFSTPPNPIGAIAAVTGLFGKGAEDPSQQQFAFINQQLQGIRKQLDTVIDLQVETLKSIEALSRQVAVMERKLLDRLDAIELEQKQIARGVKALIWKPYTDCSIAYDNRSRYFVDAQLQFISGPFIYRFTTNQASAALKCAHELNRLYAALRNPQFHDNPLRLELAINFTEQVVPDPDEKAYVKDDLTNFKSYHQFAVTLALNRWSSHELGGVANLFALYTQPSRTVAELYEKIDKLKSPGHAEWSHEPCSKHSLLTLRAKRFLCADAVEFVENRDSGNHSQAEIRADQFLREPILRDQLESIVQWTALVAHPYDFAPGGASEREPMTMSELIEAAGQDRITRGRDLIGGALFVLDLSIAQQAMLYGDLTAYFIFESLWDAEKKRLKVEAELSANDATGRLARKLLENNNNPWLREAVAMLILDSRFLKCSKRNLGVEKCKGRQMLYQMVIKQFMPIGKPEELKGEGTDATQLDNPPFVEIDPSQDQVRVGSEWMRKLFDLPEDVIFEVKRNSGGRRIVVMHMAGSELQLPGVSAWVAGGLHYPKGLQDRLRERDLMIDNYLDYTLLEEIQESGERLVRMLVAPDRSQPIQNLSN